MCTKCVPGTCGVQKRASDILELEFQTVMDRLVGAENPEQLRAVSAFNRRTISPAPVLSLIDEKVKGSHDSRLYCHLPRFTLCQIAHFLLNILSSNFTI